MHDFNLCDSCDTMILRLECLISLFPLSLFSLRPTFMPFLFNPLSFRFTRPSSLSLLFQQDREKKHLQFFRSIRLDCFAKRLNEEVSRKRASLKPRAPFGGRKKFGDLDDSAVKIFRWDIDRVADIPAMKM